MSEAARTDRTDGQAARPVLPAQTAPTPGRPNAAAKEATPAAGDGVDPRHPAKAAITIVDRAEARVQTALRKNIAICGFASSSRGLIPVDDPTWEVWGMNQLYRHIRRADRWFEIHYNWNEEVVEGTDHVGWLRDCGIPVYMNEAHDDLPSSLRFPIERMCAKFGDYFTSTVPYMLAVALDEIDTRVTQALAGLGILAPDKYEARRRELYGEYTIGIFGIDLVVEEEYFEQRPCAEYWIGMAVARGIRVFIPQPSALCKQRVRYGYQPEVYEAVAMADLLKKRKTLTEKREEHLRMLYMHDGALQAVEDLMRLHAVRTRGVEDAG